MYQKTNTILDKICAKKEDQLHREQLVSPLSKLKSRLEGMEAPVSSKKFLSKKSSAEEIQIIAEIKKASPSAGILRQDFSVVDIARTYDSCGASAISVITESNFFQGNLGYIKQIKELTALPILRKDFLFSEYHLYQSKLAGADAVLLIVALLDTSLLKDLYQLAKELGMGVLVEVHTEAELETCLTINPEIIGINNRDLQDFRVDKNTFLNLSTIIPDEIIKVVESGMDNFRDLEQAHARGADAALIGTSFMKAPDITAKFREITGGEGAD